MNFTIGEVLDAFEEAVKNHRYKKIPYDEWRDWQKCRDQEATINIGFGDGWIELSCNELLLDYRTDDRSLGEFLDNDFYWCWKPQIPSRYDLISHQIYDPAGNPIKENCRVNIKDVDNDINAYSVSNRIDSCYEKTPTVEISANGMRIKGKTVEEIIDETIGNSINRKENDSMNLFKGFDFGSCENDNVKVSMYGIAVKNATGTWVSYDPKSGNVIDVDILNFNAKYLYKMPVAIKDVAPGDVVIHNRKPMFVVKVEDGKVLTVDPAAGEEKVILLTKSMFGFDFVTKVVNFLGNFTNTASADAPFGNILPLMLLADGGKTDDMLPLMLLAGGNGNFDMNNPMMLYFLMKDSKNSDMLSLLFFANGGVGLSQSTSNQAAANS